MTPDQHRSTTAWAVVACLLWSTAFVGIKVGLRHAPPWFFAGTRFFLSGLLLIPFSGGLRNLSGDLRRHSRVIVGVALLQTFLLYSMFYTGMTLVEGALAAIVLGASPLISAALAHVFMDDDRMTRLKSVSLLGGLAGVILISLSRQPWSAQGLRSLAGIGLLLLGSVCSAGANIVVARSAGGLHPLRLSALQFALGGAGLVVLSALTETWPAKLPPAEYWIAFAWLSLMSAAAMSIWFVLLRRPGVKVSELNLWKFIMPVAGAALAWLFLPAESPSLMPLLGMALVALSVLGYFKSKS